MQAAGTHDAPSAVQRQGARMQGVRHVRTANGGERRRTAANLGPPKKMYGTANGGERRRTAANQNLLQKILFIWERAVWDLENFRRLVWHAFLNQNYVLKMFYIFLNPKLRQNILIPRQNIKIPKVRDNQSWKGERGEAIVTRTQGKCKGVPYFFKKNFGSISSITRKHFLTYL